MTTSASARRRTSPGTKKPSRTAAAKRTTAARPGKKPATKSSQSKGTPRSGDQHTVTVTIPFDRVAEAAGTVAKAPVEAARKVLPAKGGLPVYLGLGALGALGVLDWPVAVGVGVGYAVLRRGGPLSPAPADGRKGSARPESG